MENINNIKETSKFEKIVNSVNNEIYNGELTEIFEVTYSYNKNFNTTLFSDLIDGLKDVSIGDTIDINDKEKELKRVYLKAEEKLKIKKNIIEKYINEIKKLENQNEEDEIISDLLIGSLEYGKNIIEITLEGLDFEIEKAGLKIDLTKEERIEKIKEIKEIEKKVFGGEIKENPEEVVLAYEYLRTKFELIKEKLFQEEQNEYLEFLKKAEKFLPIDYEYKKEELIEKEQKKLNNENNEFLKNKISREKYIKILQEVFDLLNLDIEVKIEERGSIYDGENHLGIPNTKKYEYLTIGRILELISHEIEAHTINLKNNKQLIGYFRSAANLEKEEGLAMVMEKLLNGQKLDEIGIPQHFPKVFMGEILTGEELKKFLDLNNKIEPDTGHEGRFLRLKRNYDLELAGVQHKDTSYGRGILKIVKLLNEIKNGESDIDIRDLFLGKVGFNDIPKAKKLMKLKNIEYNDLEMPLFIGELIKYLFEVEDNNYNSRRKKGISQNDFIRYLKAKYDFINFYNIEIPTLSFIEKMKIGRILKEIKSTF